MSCLFRSLGQAVGLSADVVRGRICDFLLRQQQETPPGSELVDGLGVEEVVRAEFPGRTLQNYVEAMRSPTEFGGAIEIRAFVHLFGHGVVVEVGSTSGQKIHFPTSPAAGTDHLITLRWQNAHYELVDFQH